MVSAVTLGTRSKYVQEILSRREDKTLSTQTEDRKHKLRGTSRACEWGDERANCSSTGSGRQKGRRRWEVSDSRRRTSCSWQAWWKCLAGRRPDTMTEQRWDDSRTKRSISVEPSDKEALTVWQQMKRGPECWIMFSQRAKEWIFYDPPPDCVLNRELQLTVHLIRNTCPVPC